MNSEKALIDQLRSADPELSGKGWRYIYKNLFPMVRELVFKHQGSENDAIDVFHDGLMILNRNLKNGTFREESSVKTYIYSICRNLWLKEIGKRQKQSDGEAEFVHDLQEETRYIHHVEVVSRLMNELQEDCRTILTEYYYNRKSMDEIRQLFRLNSVQAAKNKKWRCLGYLMKLFKDKGLAHTQMTEDHEQGF